MGQLLASRSTQVAGSRVWAPRFRASSGEGCAPIAQGLPHAERVWHRCNTCPLASTAAQHAGHRKGAPFVPSGGQKQRKKAKEFHACAGGCVWEPPSLWRAISALAGRGGKFQEPPKSERLPPKLLDLMFVFVAAQKELARCAMGPERGQQRAAQAQATEFSGCSVGAKSRNAHSTARKHSTCGLLAVAPAQEADPPSSILAMCARGAQCGQVAQTQRAKGSWNAPIGAVSHALMNHAVLEPAIFGSEDQRLIHLATEPSSSRLHHIQECL